MKISYYVCWKNKQEKRGEHHFEGLKSSMAATGMQMHAIVIRQRDQNPDGSVSRSRRGRTLTKPEKIRKDAAHNWLQCKLLTNGKFEVRRVNCQLPETDVPKFSGNFLRNFSRFVRIPESRARQLESFRRADTDAMTPALRDLRERIQRCSPRPPIRCRLSGCFTFCCEVLPELDSKEY